jgi:WD40 repeat protein
MGRRQGVLLVIILLGLGVLFWTNPVMAKFDYGDNRYCNFDVQLAPVTSAAPTVVIGQRGDYGTEIYGDNKGIERVKLTFERRSNGKFYYRYSTQTISYPFDGKWSEFTPMLETEEIIIKVFSESRVADSDESGIDINVINSTGLPVHFLIYGDDQERPRVGRIQVDQGLLRVNQQDVPSGTWQGLPQVCINNYPPPYHPLEVLMQENGIDVAFSPDRSMLALASTAHIVYIYSTDDYRLLQKLEGFRYPQRLAFSPATGDNILAVGLSSGVRLFNLTSGMTTSIELKYELKDFAFSPDGQHLAIATSSKVLICDTSTGGLLRTLEMSRVPNSVAFSPDWSMLACGYSKKGIDLYNASDGTLIRSLEPVPGKEISVYNLAFSPDSQKLAGYFHSDDRGQTGGICLWKLSDGSLLNRIEDIITYYQRASKLVFTPDSQHLVTLIDDVKFWNLPGLSLEYTLSPAKDISQIAISRDGQYLACLGIERIELWQIGNVVLPETGVRMTTCLDNMQSYRYLPLCYQVFAPEAVVKGRLYINDQVFEHDVGSWHQYNVITQWQKPISVFHPGLLHKDYRY